MSESLNSASVRKRKFAASITDGRSQTEAAISADYAPTRAAVTGSELMRDPEVIRTVSTLLDAQGISREKCCQAIARAIHSENDAVSLKATELALKLHGAFTEAEAKPETRRMIDGEFLTALADRINAQRDSE